MKNNRWFSGSSVAHLFSAAKAELKLNTERRSIDRCVEAIVPCTENSTDFLKNLPSGAYTSMRTVNQTRVFYFQKHMKRLSTCVDGSLFDVWFKQAVVSWMD